MKFTVTWSKDAESELAKLWFAATDRLAIAEASDRIDNVLRWHADTAGEERSLTRRIFFVPPLAVEYRISMDDRLATVFDIWQYPHSKN